MSDRLKREQTRARTAITWSVVIHVALGVLLLAPPFPPKPDFLEESLEVGVIPSRVSEMVRVPENSNSPAKAVARPVRPGKVARSYDPAGLGSVEEDTFRTEKYPPQSATSGAKGGLYTFGNWRGELGGHRAPGPPDPAPEASIFSHPVPNVIRKQLSKELPGKQKTSTGVDVHIDRDGTIAFQNPPLISDIRVVGLALGRKFDLTEAVMNAIGDDPYSFQKKKIAEATREERLSVIIEDREWREREALFRLKGQLEAIATAPALSDAERRRHVFELWDDCPEGEGEGRWPMEAVRATVLAFIRRIFPEGTPKAYAGTELAGLNRNRSSSRLFHPYAP